VCDLENLKNEEAMTRVGSQRHKKKNLFLCLSSIAFPVRNMNHQTALNDIVVKQTVDTDAHIGEVGEKDKNTNEKELSETKKYFLNLHVLPTVCDTVYWATARNVTVRQFYDILINCIWVVTRWQYTFTHKKYIEQHK
jgi:hypothetical protein